MKGEETFVESWRMNIQVVWGNEPRPAGWRRRLGWLLRRVADRIDGRRSWAVALRTDPPLPPDAVCDCFKQGVLAIERAAVSELRAEVQERIMRRYTPQMYTR